MTAAIRFKKAARYQRGETWIVSKYDDPSDIMLNDKKTMTRIYDEIYGTTKPKEKSVLIDSILSKKVVGSGINDI